MQITLPGHLIWQQQGREGVPGNTQGGREGGRGRKVGREGRMEEGKEGERGHQFPNA